MRITLNSLTALRIVRALRASGHAHQLARRCAVKLPDPSPSRRWTRRLVSTTLNQAGHREVAESRAPIDVLVTSKESRIRARGLRCEFRTGDYPEGSFVDLGNGVAMTGPELTFVELARVMDPSVHLMLGMELCGGFSRDAADPRGGTITYGVEPVTTVERLRAFAQKAHWIRGAERALETIDCIVENAWSPMEALLATLIALPPYELGYDLWPIQLNPRKELGERLSVLSDVQSRVPDIMFAGTDVGFNYDGEDHFGLKAIAEAAMRAGQDPGSAGLARELDEKIAEARMRIVADKRRDRDLLALGLTVFSVTKEDFDEQGGLDRVMGQAIDAIERSEARNLSAQRRMLESEALAHARQELIWSLMPGQRARKARQDLLGHASHGHEVHDDVILLVGADGEERSISLEEI